MQIFVDADACPVVRIVEEIANKYRVPVTLLCDTNHILRSDYSEIVVVGAGADAVDYKLINICHKGDIVVSQDYGVAAMALGKGALAIHQSGKWYTNDNIDQMLMERHLAQKERRGNSRHHLKGPGKRTEEDDRRFAESFENLLKKALATESSSLTTPVTKFRFKIWENGLQEPQNRKTQVYEAYPSGRIVKYTYYGKCRKYAEKEEQMISIVKIKELYAQFQSIMKNDPKETIMERICDGCSYCLQVTYADGKKEVVEGDIVGERIDNLAVGFFEQEFGLIMG